MFKQLEQLSFHLCIPSSIVSLFNQSYKRNKTKLYTWNKVILYNCRFNLQLQTYTNQYVSITSAVRNIYYGKSNIP